MLWVSLGWRHEADKSIPENLNMWISPNIRTLPVLVTRWSHQQTCASNLHIESTESYKGPRIQNWKFSHSLLLKWEEAPLQPSMSVQAFISLLPHLFHSKRENEYSIDENYWATASEMCVFWYHWRTTPRNLPPAMLGRSSCPSTSGEPKLGKIVLG